MYPEPVAAGFELAAELGYDGVELMVWGDRVSQDVAAVGRLAERHGVPVVAVHAPCLAVTQRVWGADPIVRIRRSVAAAAAARRHHRGAAPAVPLAAAATPPSSPTRWPARARSQASRWPSRTCSRWCAAACAPCPTSPGFDPTEVGHRHYTLDLSHTATAGVDALALLERMGAGLTHLHLADGSGGPRDEHLVPGRGTQPCAEVLQRLADTGYRGAVVAEVSTRRCRTRYERAELLARVAALRPAAPAAHRTGADRARAERARRRRRAGGPTHAP